MTDCSSLMSWCLYLESRWSSSKASIRYKHARRFNRSWASCIQGIPANFTRSSTSYDFIITILGRRSRTFQLYQPCVFFMPWHHCQLSFAKMVKIGESSSKWSEDQFQWYLFLKRSQSDLISMSICKKMP